MDCFLVHYEPLSETNVNNRKPASFWIVHRNLSQIYILWFITNCPARRMNYVAGNYCEQVHKNVLYNHIYLQKMCS